MEKLAVILFFCCTLCGDGKGQLIGFKLPDGLSGSDYAANDGSSVWTNPAGMPALKGSYLGVSFQQPFLLNAFSTYSLGFGVPLGSKDAISMTLKSTGDQYLKTSVYSLGYGRKLFENINIGGRLHYLTFRAPDYGFRGMFTFDVGAILAVNKVLNIGFHAFNPIPFRINDDQLLPSVFNISIGYRPSSKVAVYLDYEKNLHRKSNFILGIAYNPVEKLHFKASWQTTPAGFCLGIGYSLYHRFTMTFSGAYKQDAGYIPGAVIHYYKK